VDGWKHDFKALHVLKLHTCHKTVCTPEVRM